MALRPRVTDTVKVSILDWDDVIDRTALGFDQLKPPGLAEITALDAGRASRSPPPTPRATGRGRSTLPCGRGPIIAIAGQFVQTSIDTTVGALLDGDPIPARPCQADPDRAARGPAGAADQPRRRVRRRRRPARRAVGPPISKRCNGSRHRPEHGVPTIARWTSPHRQASRVLVVPESVNPGWTARTGDGTRLTPGHRQRLAAGLGRARRARRAPSHCTFASNAVYRAGHRGRPGAAADAGAAGVGARASPAAARRPGTAVAAGSVSPRGLGVLAVGVVVAGVAGVVVVGAAIGVRYVLRNRPGLVRRDHRRHQRGRADPGRRGAVAEPVAIGGRLRRALRGCAAAGADLGRRAGGIGRPVAIAPPQIAPQRADDRMPQ